MLEIYNYLIPAYARPAKSNVTSLSSNVKDIKGLYNRIRSMNVSSPLYMISLSDEKQSFALGIKEAALSLKYETDTLADESNKLFDFSKTISTDPEVLEVNSLPDSAPLAAPVLVKVHKLMTLQTNAGTPVIADKLSLLDGPYRFRVNTDNGSYTFRMDVSGRSTNREILGNLSDFINRTKIGLEAFTQSDEELGTIQLFIRAKETGSGRQPLMQFSIEDVPGTDNRPEGIIEYYGLNNVALRHEGSIYEVDGNIMKSSSNTFMLNNSLEITLKSITGDAVSIKEMPDGERILNSVDNVITSFNNLMKLANDNSADRSARKLTRSLSSAIISNKETLNECGILRNNDGTLSIDRDIACNAAENGKLEELFKKGGSLYNSLINTASSITFNPMDYVDKKIVTYPDTARTIAVSPYISSIYCGMLFNYYC